MTFLASRGYRCVAHDRRGHGRSSQPWVGNDMDTYADDLAALIETLNLNQAILAGHSTGGEVARYIGRDGTKRVAKAVLISAVPPLMLKTPANPGGLPREAFDDIRAKVPAGRSQFFKDLSAPFYGANRLGAKVSQPTLIIHGDDDQIAPIGASTLHSSKIIKGAALKTYPGAPHGLCSTHKNEVNANLLAFCSAPR